MYKKILVPTDGSEYADKEISIASDLIDEDGEIIILSVAKHVIGGPFQAKQELDEINSVFIEAAEFYVEAMQGKFDSKINTVTKIVKDHSSPAEAICQVADDEDVDLIVISTAGERGLQVIGSVAEKVSRLSDKNVFLIH